MSEKRDKLIEIYPATGERRGRFLTCHGFNSKPSTLESYITLLTQKGYEVYNIKLHGYRGLSSERGHTTSAHWLRDFYRAYQLARQGEEKLHFLGYSTGSLICALAQNSKIFSLNFDKIIHLAPAYALKKKTYILALSRYLPGKWGLPLLDENSLFCAEKVNYFSLYRSLFGLLFRFNKNKKVQGSPLVLSHPNDEIISFSQLRKFGDEKLLFAIGDMINPKEVKHFIFHQQFLATSSWQKIVERINDFLF